MTPFLGIVHLAGGEIDPVIEDRAHKLPPSRTGRPSILRLPGAVFVHSQGSALFQSQNGRTAFAASARLDNRDELAAAVGGSAASTSSDAALLFRTFERRRDPGVARCLGAFTFAHWNSDARRLILGRDCLGNDNLYCHRQGDLVFFSNRLRSLLAIPHVPRQIDEVAIINVLVRNMWEQRRTVYRGIESVPPCSLLAFDRDGTRQTRYWAPDLNAVLPYRRDEDYIERARELFDQAVRSTTAGADEVAIATSGGLDSSAIAATVARLGGVARVACYTVLNPPDVRAALPAGRYEDERGKVEALGRMYPKLDLTFRNYGDPHPFEDDSRRYFARTSYPAASGLEMSGKGHMADWADGHRVFMSGHHGNLGLTWGGRLSLPALLRAGEWRRFARELPLVAHHSGTSIGRTLSSGVLWPVMPGPARRVWERFRGRATYRGLRFSPVNRAVLEQIDLFGGDDAAVLALAGGPRGWSSARWRAAHLFDIGVVRGDPIMDENKMPAVRDPFSDRRLLEFALAVPEPLYRRNGVPRSFARAVFADRLPREILDEARTGANQRGWFRNVSRLRPQLADDLERIAASPGASRLLDIPRLKRLMDEWPKDEATAESRRFEYTGVLARGVHFGNFIRWVEGGNR